jgi:virginiamycin B lyase
MTEASCGSRDGRRQALILATAVAGIVLLAACSGGSSSSPGAHVSAYVYWANSNNSTIGRANLNGTGVNQRFITGVSPRMVAVTSRYVYWASGTSTIGRANLNGSGVNQRFITGANRPDALVIDSKYVYWANWGNGTIGRANLDGTSVNQSFLAVRRGRPVGVAVLPGP